MHEQLAVINKHIFYLKDKCEQEKSLSAIMPPGWSCEDVALFGISTHNCPAFTGVTLSTNGSSLSIAQLLPET